MTGIRGTNLSAAVTLRTKLLPALERDRAMPTAPPVIDASLAVVTLLTLASSSVCNTGTAQTQWKSSRLTELTSFKLNFLLLINFQVKSKKLMPARLNCKTWTQRPAITWTNRFDSCGRVMTNKVTWINFRNLSGEAPNVFLFPSRLAPSSWAHCAAVTFFFSDDTTPTSLQACSANWWSRCPPRNSSVVEWICPAAKLSR